jgi:transmembrane sensor
MAEVHATRDGESHATSESEDDPGSEAAARKRELIVEEAANWQLRLNDAGATTYVRFDYVQWLKESPAHVAEALRMQGLEELLRDAKLDQLPRDPTAHATWWRSVPTLKLIAAIAAFVLLVVAVLIINIRDFNRSIETHTGEWKDLALPAGITAHLGPLTNLRYDFSDRQRVIQLSRGEVMFEVADDPDRPFQVNAGLAAVRTVGAQFAVSREAQQVLVTVAEGKVEVSQGDYARMQSLEQGMPVAAGNQLRMKVSGPLGIRPVNVTRELAWVQRILIFSDATVAEAIHEFNRRNRVQIEVTDPAVDIKPVSGSFSADDPESFAKALEQSLDLKIRREGPDRLLLESGH